MKVKKETLIFVVIISILILFVSLLVINSGPQGEVEITESFASCLGEQTTLYVQEGCSACDIQEEMFGPHYNQLDTIDCVYNQEACRLAEISATPTWVINGQKIIGVQYPDRLSQISGCEL